MKKKLHPVHIVGAGPGDPELLTVKAINLIKKADLVIYDRLIPPELIAVIPKKIERIYAGKSCKKHEMTQEEINRELANQARRGKKVVRLKGGDPMIFGRGGEEAIYLKKHNIEFEIVPGISAASGISAKFAIPLTHRGIATGVKYITGHQQKGKPVIHNWKELADPSHTLVIYMGLAHLDEMVENLIKAGLSPNTRAAAIQDGTCKNERHCFASLSKITEKLHKLHFEPPVLIIIGKVVRLAEKLI